MIWTVKEKWDVELTAILSKIFSKKELSLNSEIRHAMCVRSSVINNHYVQFFRLYERAPKFSKYLMKPLVRRFRDIAFNIFRKGYYPNRIPISYICKIVAFKSFQ